MKKIILLIIFVIMAPAGLHAEQNYLEVTAQGNRQTPLAVAPAVTLGGGQDPRVAGAIEDIFKFDLSLAGPFSVIAGTTSAGTGGIRPGEFDFSPWKAIGTVYLIKSGYTLSGANITLEFRFYDVSQGKQLAAKRYTGSSKELRWMVHAFSDEVMLSVTGEKGPFTGKIVYVSKATGNKEIGIMDYDGHNARRITRNGSINLDPDLSPNGNEILFTSYKRGNPDLFRASVLGGAEACIAAHRGINFTGAWSPDGSKIALSMSKDGNPEIYVINKSGKQLAKLTNNNSINISPAWSPDGSKIAFVSDRAGSPQIYIMNSDGTGVRRLTYNGKYNVNPAWSPKGDRILYSRQQSGFQIYSINTDGSGDTQLTSDGRNENPHWSPDGRFITFSSNRDGQDAVYVMRADGTSQIKVSRSKGGDTQPMWSHRP